MAEREDVEEKAKNSWYQRSLGVIYITEGPIKWISILKKTGPIPPRWWAVLGIPDDRLFSTSQETKTKTILETHSHCSERMSFKDGH